jgi:hypothetical protein
MRPSVGSVLLEQRYLDVLRELSVRLEVPGSSVLWVVAGSAAFALQGLPVTVHDVDIQTDTAGAYEMERRFAASVTRPVRYATAERIRSHLGALILDGITAEVMGDISEAPAGRRVGRAGGPRAVSPDGGRRGHAHPSA